MYSRNLYLFIIFIFLFGGLGSCSQFLKKINSAQSLQNDEKEWPVYGGNAGANRYSPLNQINTSNVNQLQVAWTYHTGDNSGKRGTEMQSQPIMVKGIL